MAPSTAASSLSGCRGAGCNCADASGLIHDSRAAVPGIQCGPVVGGRQQPRCAGALHAHDHPGLPLPFQQHERRRKRAGRNGWTDHAVAHALVLWKDHHAQNSKRYAHCLGPVFSDAIFRRQRHVVWLAQLDQQSRLAERQLARLSIGWRRRIVPRPFRVWHGDVARRWLASCCL